MRRLLPLLSLCLLATAFITSAGAQPYYPPGYYPPPPRAYYARPRYPGPAYSPENCGTPDHFKPCPPLPRVPLPYYPGDR
jgi:hypothetical protein